jgi:hypothetical protein
MIGNRNQLKKALHAGFTLFLLAFGLTYARPARACTGWGPFCLEDIIPVVQACSIPTPSCFKATMQFQSNVSARAATFMYGALASGAQFVFNCSDQDLGGISGACFPDANNFDSRVGYYQTIGTVPATCQDFTQIKCLKPDQCSICTPEHQVLVSHTISTANANQTDRMRSVVYILDSDTRTDFTHGYVTNQHFYSVRDTVNNYVAYFMDGHSTAATVAYPFQGDENADTPAVAAVAPGAPRAASPIIIWPSAYDLSDLSLAGVVVHEVDHTRFGLHDDLSNDLAENGPWGTQIQWLARVAKDGWYGDRTVADVDRLALWNSAVHLTSSKISQQDARDRLFSILALSPTVLSVAAPATPCVRDSDYFVNSRYRWAGYADNSSSRSVTGGRATDAQIAACTSGQPAGWRCMFWECRDPLTYGPMLTYHGGSVNQSSTGWEGDAARAVDGNLDGDFWHGSVTYTVYGEPGGWWQAALGDQFAITSIDIYGRTDCCPEMLTDYSVVLQDAEGYNIASDIRSGSTTIDYWPPKPAAYVTIQQPPESIYPLMLTEVRVWGYHVPYVAHLFTNPGRSTACGTFTTDQGLLIGASPLASCDGRFLLVLDQTGDLALYSASGRLWHSDTSGLGAVSAIMQGDGNFVLYSPLGPVWATGSVGQDGSRFVLQNDGNLVVYNPSDVPVWASNTCCH